MNSNKKFYLIICILGVIVLGLVGYISYDKFFAKTPATGECKKCDVCKCEEGQVVVNETNCESNNYDVFATNAKKFAKLFGTTDGVTTKIVENVTNYGDDKTFNVSLEGGIATISYENNVIATVNDVLYFSSSHIGNGGTNGIYFVMNNGTVSEFRTVDYLGTNSVEVKKLDGLKNIVAIVQTSSVTDDYSGGSSPMFIDINGNFYDMAGNLMK